MIRSRTMADEVTRLRTVAVERALTGAGTADPAARRAAFDHATPTGPAQPLLDKVARNAWKVADEDVAAAARGGVSEDQIFELAVCAAYGAATRQLQSALAALDAVTDPA